MTPERRFENLVYDLASDATDARYAARDAERRYHNALAQYEGHILPERRDYAEEDSLAEMVAVGSREARDALESGEDRDTAARRVWAATDRNLPDLAAEWIVERTREKLEEQP